MPQDVSTVVRPRIVTGNGAAQFLEVCGDRVIGAEHRPPSAPEPQYDPIRDEFMSPQDVDRTNYFKTAEVKMQQLESSLVNLNETIRKRKYDRKLNITLKEPRAYTMNEVLVIATKIEREHRNAGKAKTAMGLIRRCFRSVGDDPGNMKRFLAFVPGDAYGSIISGAFAMVLGSAEHAGSIRENIYETLGDIPLQLKEIQDLGNVYFHSAALREAADSVLVAIFSILDCCVDELSKNFGTKFMGHILKGDGYAANVKKAIASLEKAISDFKRYAFIDMNKSLGRTKITVENTEKLATSTYSTVKETNVAVNGTNDMMKGMCDRFLQFEKTYKDDMSVVKARLSKKQVEKQTMRNDPQERERMRHQENQTIIYNQFYALFTASPIFDPRTGSARYDMLQWPQPHSENPAFSQSGIVSPQESNENRKIIKIWMKLLKPAHYSVKEYMNYCLERFATMSLEAKDQIQWIMTSSELREWLRSTQSEILIIQSQMHMEDLYNALTFSAALLRKLLQNESFDYLIMCAFCRLRANDSMNERISGPSAMVASLLAQLLTQIKNKRPETVVTGIGKPADDLMSPQTLVEKLQYLLEALPERDTVFIILDNVEYLSGSDSASNLAIEMLLKLKQLTKVTVKILVTGIVLPATLDKFEHQMHFVPDDLDGGLQGVHHEFYEGNSLQAILDFNQEMKEDTNLEESESKEEFDEEDWV